MELQKQINDLTDKRERIKQELFECEALRAMHKERWVVYKESTPLTERVELDAKIAALVQDRQSSKVRLAELKRQRGQYRDTTFMGCVKTVLKDARMDKELDMIFEKFNQLYEGAQQ